MHEEETAGSEAMQLEHGGLEDADHFRADRRSEEGFEVRYPWPVGHSEPEADDFF